MTQIKAVKNGYVVTRQNKETTKYANYRDAAYCLYEYAHIKEKFSSVSF